MRQKGNGMPTQEIARLYEGELRKLEEALLQGVAWEELREQRALVTRLAMQVHRTQCRISTSHPAAGEERRQREKPKN